MWVCEKSCFKEHDNFLCDERLIPSYDIKAINYCSSWRSGKCFVQSFKLSLLYSTDHFDQSIFHAKKFGISELIKLVLSCRNLWNTAIIEILLEVDGRNPFGVK